MPVIVKRGDVKNLLFHSLTRAKLTKVINKKALKTLSHQ
ncbi:hypothetical protein [Enterococcus sp. AZ163]